MKITYVTAKGHLLGGKFVRGKVVDHYWVPIMLKLDSPIETFIDFNEFHSIYWGNVNSRYGGIN